MLLTFSACCDKKSRVNDADPTRVNIVLCSLKGQHIVASLSIFLSVQSSMFP